MKLTNWGELEPEISDLIGKTFKSVMVNSDELILIGDCGTFRFYHDQDCCETVQIHDIVGDIKDLEGSPILLAEEVKGETPSDWAEDDCTESYTLTFYKFATRKGYVDIRWLGESNGYYSESVQLDWEKP